MKAITPLLLIVLLLGCALPKVHSSGESVDSSAQQRGNSESLRLSDKSDGYFVITELTDTTSSGKVYSFPVFASDESHKSHEKINRTLQLAELELIVGEQDSSIFEKIWPEEGSFFGTTELQLRIIQNTNKFLTLEFSKEGCGAYCEWYSSYYNFDAQTGEQIETDTLFTKDGLKELARIIIEARRQLIRENIIENPVEQEDREANEMFEDCLNRMNEDHFHWGKFYIDRDKIHFIGERCSNHAMRALDVIDEFDNVMSFAELEEYLSDYGKKLLLK
jgi:hypothetical protein